MKKLSNLLAVFFAVLVFVSVSNAQSTFAVGTVLEDFKLTDINGKEQSFNGLKGEKGTVLIWLSAQCPVVKGYNERINQVAADYESKGIKFIGINSNATESLDWVKSNAAEVGYKFPVLIDKDNVLADKLGASVTPEVYFFDAKSTLLYHGAIDNDKYGKNISDNYLRTAFDSSLAGKKIERTKANATGCSIKRAAQ
ncbi:MAG: redoxin domain-containing protein [Pyrinomonadaceae bacterium]|nr:redoxin domain-containing protein [Pyrinomonadaceae bacterium]